MTARLHGRRPERERDTSRLFFLPSRPNVVGDGQALDVDGVLECAAVMTPRIGPSPQPRSSTHATTGDLDIYAALAELNQGAVLLEISGSKLVGGKTVTLSAS